MTYRGVGRRSGWCVQPPAGSLRTTRSVQFVSMHRDVPTRRIFATTSSFEIYIATASHQPHVATVPPGAECAERSPRSDRRLSKACSLTIAGLRRLGGRSRIREHEGLRSVMCGKIERAAGYRTRRTSYSRKTKKKTF